MTTDYHYFNPKPSAPECSWESHTVECQECENRKEVDSRIPVDSDVEDRDNAVPAYCPNCEKNTLHDNVTGE